MTACDRECGKKEEYDKECGGKKERILIKAVAKRVIGVTKDKPTWRGREMVQGVAKRK